MKNSVVMLVDRLRKFLFPDEGSVASGETSQFTSSLPLYVRLETERLDLLYRQNKQGLIALLIYCSIYLYIARDSQPKWFLWLWATVLLTSALIRILLTYKWNRIQKEIRHLKQVVPWVMAMEGLLLVSGLSWGVIGWFIPSMPTTSQQVTTSVIIVLMAAGAVVAYSSSLAAMLSVLCGALIPWAASLTLSGQPEYQIMAGMLGIYVVIGLVVGRNLNQYVLRSIRLNVENSLLATNLARQMRIKDRAQKELQASQDLFHMALDASGTAVWTWNTHSDEMALEGPLATVLGREERSWVTRFDEFLALVLPEDRAKVKEKMQKALKQSFEIEFRIPAPAGGVHYLILTGQNFRHGDERTTVVVGTLSDVTVKKSQEVLRQEISEHEAANRAKSVLLASASHEIRTPLSAINGFTSVLLQNKTLPADVREDLQLIFRNGQYLSALVNDLLDLSKLESGKIYIEKTQMPLVSEIEDILKIVTPRAEAKGLEIGLMYVGAVPDSIETDATRFREIMINLLTNAVSYTSLGRIDVRVSFEKTRDHRGILKIVVEDTGLGMPESEQRYLFRPFSRGDDVVVQRHKGSGLGLALSRNLAKLMGGDLTLLRSERGHGSEFQLTLPTSILADVKMITPVHGGGLKTSPEFSLKSEPSGIAGQSLLVVDDSEDLQILMKRCLEMQGGHVDLVSNGQEALERLEHFHYDVVLMDIKMPIMDGYEAVKKLRKRGYEGPVIAVTAHASAEDQQRCFEAGFDSYISKPVNFRRLTDEILGFTRPPLVS